MYVMPQAASRSASSIMTYMYVIVFGRACKCADGEACMHAWARSRLFSWAARQQVGN
jgi:hypothetical protein